VPGSAGSLRLRLPVADRPRDLWSLIAIRFEAALAVAVESQARPRIGSRLPMAGPVGCRTVLVVLQVVPGPARPRLERLARIVPSPCPLEGGPTRPSQRLGAPPIVPHWPQWQWHAFGKAHWQGQPEPASEQQLN